LAKYAGINENSINKALQELENNWLIKTVDGGWLIYLKTKNLQCHSSKELNAKAEKSFGYVTKSKETQEVGNSH
jgi:DNA-binding transcriptional regulator YhcF (GntR family)